jgi:hypothetical protein
MKNNVLCGARRPVLLTLLVLVVRPQAKEQQHRSLPALTRIVPNRTGRTDSIRAFQLDQRNYLAPNITASSGDGVT